MSVEVAEVRAGRRMLPGVVGAALLVLAVALSFLLINPEIYYQDDMQVQHVPGSFDIAKAWSNGEFPLLSRVSWAAAPLGGEFQYGVFSVFLTVCNIVAWKLPLTFAGVGAFLSMVHLLIAGSGAYVLARAYRLSHALALLVTLIGTFNGFLFQWGAISWYPVLTSFAWVPWFWLGLRRLDERPTFGGIVLTGVSLYLIIAAGWPFTLLMVAFLAVMYVVPQLINLQWRSFAATAVAGALGLALAAAPILLLLEHLPWTVRQQMSGGDPALTVPLAGFLGMVLPGIESIWNVFYFEVPHHSTEFGGAFVPFVAVVMAVCLLRFWYLVPVWRELTIAVLSGYFAWAMSYGMFRWSFRWLPLFHLALAIAGALALTAVQSNERFARGRWSPGLWAVGITLACTYIAAHVAINLRALVPIIALTLGSAIVWALADRLAGARATGAVTIAATLVSLFCGYLLVEPANKMPRFRLSDEQLRRAAPFDPSRRYILIFFWGDVMRRDLHRRPTLQPNPLFRPGNLTMYSGVEFVNGYTPMSSIGMRELFLFGIHSHTLEFIAPGLATHETRLHRRFDHLGVDGFTIERKLYESLKIDFRPRWEFVTEAGGTLLFHRARPRYLDVQLAERTLLRDHDEGAAIWLRKRKSDEPLWVLTGLGRNERFPRERCTTAVLSNVRDERLRSAVTIDTTSCKEETVVVFMRPWAPGFAGRVGDQPAKVLKAEVLMPAVVVKPGLRTEVEVAYRPRSVALGLKISALAIFLTVLGGALVSWRRRSA